MLIRYKGETLDTVFYRQLSDSEFESLRNDYYSKPDFEKVKKQFISISKGGTKNNEITNYYVKDLMAKTKIWYNKWSIEDVFNSKDLLGFFREKIEHFPKIFPKNQSVIKNIETAMRIGGKGIASKPANFPIKTVDYILNKYNVNNNYYDFSCGWGARLTSSLKNNVNYYGTDPNYLLTERLKNLTSDYKNSIENSKSNVDIRTQGSEIFNPDWENKMGLAFSSPPYFYLEDYKIGDQSWKEGTSYESWLSDYLEPTIQNIYLYLIQEGFFILNINNFKDFDLVGECIKIAERNGFLLVKLETLDNISRCNSAGGMNDNNEKIMVFIKSDGNKFSDLD